MERTASFRGVEFPYETIRVFNIGRRGQECEFLYRDETSYEDLGKSAFRIEVNGEWCSGDRDDIENLRAALETEGAGEFIDPLWGVLDVAAMPTSEIEISGQYDEYARFRLEFRETGTFRFPTATQSTRINPAATIDTIPTISNLGGDFAAFVDASLGAASLNWAATSGSLFTDYGISAYAVLTGMRAFPAQYLARPDASGLIYSTIETIAIGHTDKRAGLEFLIDTYSNFSTATQPTVNTSFANDAYQAALDFDKAVRLSALIQAALLVEEISFVSTQDAIALRDDILEWFAREMDGCDNFAQLMRLRLDMLKVFSERIVVLPSIKRKCFNESLPAVVIAHMMFGDYTRWEEVKAQNPNQSPLFMPQLIEVVDA